MDILIQEVNHLEELKALKESWNNFVKTEKPDQWFFHSFEWISAWWHVFGANGRPVILLAYINLELVGIMPFYAKKKFYLGIYVKSIRLMGNEHSAKTPIVIKENDCQIINDMLTYITKTFKKTLIIIEDIPKDEIIYKRIIDYCKNNQVDYKERVERVTPIIKIEDKWEGYLLTRSDNFRKKLKQVTIRVRNLENLRVVHYKNEDSLVQCFDRMKIVALNSWQGKQGTSFLVGNKLFKFYFQIASYAATNGLLDIKILEYEKGPISFLYDIRIDGKLYSLKKEFDRNYSRCSPGVFLDMVTLKEDFMNKFTMIDLLGYNTDDKSRWATHFLEDARIFIYAGALAKVIKYIDFNIRYILKIIIRRNISYEKN